jgi:hypothetical protein
MIDLLLVSCFTAFFLAVFDYLIRVITINTGPTFINTVASLSLSTLGSFLTGYPFDKKVIVIISASAFLGRVLLKAAERLATYRPTIVNSAGQ